MVVKALKRKSINSSGVWEVEESKPEVSKKQKFDGTPKSQKGQIERKNASPLESHSSSVVSGQQGHGLLSPKQGKQQKLQKNKDQHTLIETPPKIENVQMQQQNQQQKDRDQHSDSEMPPKKGHIQKQQQENQNQQEDALSPKQGNRQKQQQINQNQSKKQERQPVQNEDHKFIASWPSGDLLQLVVRLDETYKHLHEEPYVKALKGVDWSEISFGEHSAEDCQKMWNILFNKARSTRELVEEARAMFLGTKLVKVAQPSAPEDESQNDTEPSQKALDEEPTDEDSDDEEEEEEEDGNDNEDTNEEDDDDDDDDDDDE